MKKFYDDIRVELMILADEDILTASPDGDDDGIELPDDEF